MSTESKGEQANQANSSMGGADQPQNDDQNKTVMNELFGGLAVRDFSNFPAEPMAKYRLMSKACGADVVKGGNMIGKEVHCHYFYFHRIEIVDQKTQEVFDSIRTVLLSSSGEAIAFVSDGIVRDVLRIIQAFGMGPYDPDLVFNLRQIQTRTGQRTYTLELAE